MTPKQQSTIIPRSWHIIRKNSIWSLCSLSRPTHFRDTCCESRVVLSQKGYRTAGIDLCLFPNQNFSVVRIVKLKLGLVSHWWLSMSFLPCVVATVESCPGILGPSRDNHIGACPCIVRSIAWHPHILNPVLGVFLFPPSFLTIRQQTPNPEPINRKPQTQETCTATTMWAPKIQAADTVRWHHIGGHAGAWPLDALTLGLHQPSIAAVWSPWSL